MRSLIRVRMATRDGHYGGGLVDGAKLLELCGDVATELCIRAYGDEGLFRAYEQVEFLRPVRSGDFIEVEGEVVGWGRTSLKISFVARKVVTPFTGGGASAADWLAQPEVVFRADGICVVPENCKRPIAEGRVDVGRPGPCVLTAAIVGAETTRAQNPNLPLTAEEIGEEARRCAAAGASVIHLHVRDAAGRPSQDPDLFRAAIRAIRSRAEVIIQASTGGAVGMGVDERCGALKLRGDDVPDMATLNVGSINFGDEIFTNPAPLTEEIARRIRTAGVVPEIEVYDAGHLDIAAELLRNDLIGAPLHVQFVLGVRGALSATERNLDFLLRRLDELPHRVAWGIAGVGRHQFPLADLAILRGGNVRVGLEDNLYLERGVLAEGSAPLVEKAAAMIRARGREVASVAQAREIIGASSSSSNQREPS